MFTLPAEVLAALQAASRRECAEPGEILRAALVRDLKLRARQQRNARRDPALAGALRTLLARDFAQARDWSDLRARLAVHGYGLHENGGRLGLILQDGGDRILDVTAIGASYGALMRRFQGPITQIAPRAAVAGRAGTG